MHAQGIFLLFEHGVRPGKSAIKEFANSNSGVALSHDPSATKLHLVGKDGGDGDRPLDDIRQAGGSDAGWVELLFSGLTFELHGLGSSSCVTLPPVVNAFDFASIDDAQGLEATVLTVGEHLAGGGQSLPVVKGMMELACRLVRHFDDVRAVVWPPSQSVIGRRFFESTVTAWLDGGAFPAIGLTAFEQTDDGALKSQGLAYFIGQEILIELPLSADLVTATRLGVRLVNQLVLTGGVSTAEQVIAPAGLRLILEPSENSKIVSVRIE